MVRAPPPEWSDERLEEDRTKAIEAFRNERLTEPLEEYLEVFEVYRDAFDDLLETTVDLTQLSERAIEVLTDKRFLEAVRYIAAPPLSHDDLVTLSEAKSLAPKVIRADKELVKRIVSTILDGHDRRRFPWVTDEREATETERASAVLASAALLATQRVNTGRRNQAREDQEKLVAEALTETGIVKVDPRSIATLSRAPNPGKFCGESMLGDRKADLVVGLWDGRVMPIECKVSNSAVVASFAPKMTTATARSLKITSASGRASVCRPRKRCGGWRPDGWPAEVARGRDRSSASTTRGPLSGSAPKRATKR